MKILIYINMFFSVLVLSLITLLLVSVLDYKAKHEETLKELRTYQAANEMGWDQLTVCMD